MPWIERVRTEQPLDAVGIDATYASDAFLLQSYTQPIGAADSSGFSARSAPGFNNPVGYQMHGYFVGEAPTLATTVLGQAMSFDGTTNRLYTSGRTGLANGASPDESFVVVFIPNSTTGRQVLAGYFSDNANNPSNYGRGIWLDSGVIKASGVSATNGKILSSGITVATGTPYVVGARCSAAGALFVNGVKTASGALDHSWTYAMAIASGQGTAGGFLYPFSGKIALVYGVKRGLSDGELASLTTNPWQIFAKERVFVPATGGAITHATTGVLTGQGSTVAGSATRTHAHPSSGVLAGAGATVDGSAARTHEHSSSGVLTGAGATVDGAAARAGVVVHDTTGTPTGAGASVVGSAARVAVHGTSGALAGQGATINGTAQHNVPHGTSGDLTGPGSVVTGSAFNGISALTKSGVNRAWLVKYYTQAFAEQEAKRKELEPATVKPAVPAKKRAAAIAAKVEAEVAKVEGALDALATGVKDLQAAQTFIYNAVQQSRLTPQPEPINFLDVAEAYRKKLKQEEDELMLLALVL